VDPQYEKQQTGSDINLGLIALIMTASTVFLIVIIVLVAAWYYNWVKAEHERRVVRPPYVKLQNQMSDQRERLHSYRLVDKDQGIAQVPIDEAITRFVRSQHDDAGVQPK
jgi:hypothetical protein